MHSGGEAGESRVQRQLLLQIELKTRLITQVPDWGKGKSKSKSKFFAMIFKSFFPLPLSLPLPHLMYGFTALRHGLPGCFHAIGSLLCSSFAVNCLHINYSFTFSLRELLESSTDVFLVFSQEKCNQFLIPNFHAFRHFQLFPQIGHVSSHGCSSSVNPLFQSPVTRSMSQSPLQCFLLYMGLHSTYFCIHLKSFNLLPLSKLQP